MPNLGSEEEQQEVKHCSSSLRRCIRQFYDARKWEEKILVLMSERKVMEKRNVSILKLRVSLLQRVMFQK
jgi:hypothetical protein